MDIKALVDLAIEDDPMAPCLWIASEDFAAFCAVIAQRPNLIGAVIYRGKTIRDGGPGGEVRTRR